MFSGGWDVTWSSYSIFPVKAITRLGFGPKLRLPESSCPCPPCLYRWDVYEPVVSSCYLWSGCLLAHTVSSEAASDSTASVFKMFQVLNVSLSAPSSD